MVRRGLAAQYNTGTGEYYAYHYGNSGSTSLITDRSGQAVERFSYGTYGELIKDSITKICFLYNGNYGVATDRNGLYYMRDVTITRISRGLSIRISRWGILEAAGALTGMLTAKVIR